MKIASVEISSLRQFNRWLGMIAHSAAVGAIDLVRNNGLVVKATNPVATTYSELQMRSLIEFEEVVVQDTLTFMVNFNELISYVQSYVKKNQTTGILDFYLDGDTKSSINFRRSMIDEQPNFPAEFISQSFPFHISDFKSHGSLVLKIPLLELQEIIKELSIVGRDTWITVLPNYELVFWTKGKLGTIQFEMSKGVVSVLHNGLLQETPFQFQLSLSNICSLTFLATSHGSIRMHILPRKAVLFETDQIGVVKTHLVVAHNDENSND